MENFVAKGMICDVAVHDPDKGEGGIPNPHVHVLVPIRPVNTNGEWGEKRLHIPVFDEDGKPVLNKKGKQKYDDPFTTDWGKPETLEIWRENWAKIVNEKFAEKGLTCHIDHRSNEDFTFSQTSTRPCQENTNINSRARKTGKTGDGSLSPSTSLY